MTAVTKERFLKDVDVDEDKIKVGAKTTRIV